MKNIIAIALLSTAIGSGAAYAQQAQPADRAATAATNPVTSSEKMMVKNDWRVSKLMGLHVYNEANEKLGDINELLLDKNGKVNAVVIGVGGFLGMGEHDIAVTMDKLKFIEEPVRTSSTAPGNYDARNDDRNCNGAGEHHHHNDDHDHAQRERLGSRSCRDERHQGAA